jgi:hypothetical protein
VRVILLIRYRLFARRKPPAYTKVMTGPQALIAIAGDLRPKLSNSFQTKLILSSEIMGFFAENAWHVIGLLASLDSFYGIQSVLCGYRQARIFCLPFGERRSNRVAYLLGSTNLGSTKRCT